MSDDAIRIYVACLASYNAGRLHGTWIDATQDADDVHAAIYDAHTEERAPLATDDDRVWLARHAAEVVAAFAALHQLQAEAFAAAAAVATTGRV